ncbi:MAG: dihydrolipoyllysine-residue acetyltransferase [Gammaproteobacteria bacterium]|nr:dihydrolipoyllysine-residue acetyltransferase [Gammaproteobacteria bacterium]OUU10679.1 MAG: dihydrolipoyllysine-residue acetyltransferase [Gammaproteobacteria bacterium TMED34]
MSKQILVPDVGEADEVSVIEILVNIGDVVSVDDSLVVLESEKASMEIPSPFAGRVTSITIKEGDEVDEGDLLLELDTAGTNNEEDAASASKEPKGSRESADADAQAPSSDSQANNASAANVAATTQANEPTAAVNAEIAKAASSEQIIVVPDVGEAKDIVVTEILVSVGDTLSEEDSILVLESEKASMEIPSPMAGQVQALLVAEGAEVDEGDELIRLLVTVEPSGSVLSTSTPAPEQTSDHSSVREPGSADVPVAPQIQSSQGAPAVAESGEAADVYAGPAVRKQARELGVRLSEMKGSGRKGRILKEDVQAYVKQRLSGVEPEGGSPGGPTIPEVDFSRWGEVEDVALPRIRQFSARNLHRSWLNIPHVTQFDEADVTELEAFRKEENARLAADGKKLTPLAFIVRACVSALREYPRFNSSIKSDFTALTIKQYINIGIAVETDDGLMVPVIKNADQLGVVELAEICGELAAAARNKKLPMDAMQGATFTISSLGGIGGKAFTPIVNAPEVAILGVSRTSVTPQWNGEAFIPRSMLPLSLSYDHRAIDGAEAARFTRYLAEVLTDIRRLVL